MSVSANSMQDFMTTYFAAVCSVKDGDVAEIELMLTTQDEHDRSRTLMVTIRSGEYEPVE